MFNFFHRPYEMPMPAGNEIPTLVIKYSPYIILAFVVLAGLTAEWFYTNCTTGQSVGDLLQMKFVRGIEILG